MKDDKDDDDVDGEEIVETNIVLDRLRRAAKAQVAYRVFINPHIWLQYVHGNNIS